MSTGLTGDFAELADLIGSFRRVARGFPTRLNRNLSQAALALVEEEHATGRDPYGAPWLPNQRGSSPPLTKTGALRDGWRAFFGPASFGLQNNAVYARIQNSGGRTGRNYATSLPSRRLVPEDTFGPIWGAAFEEVTEATFRSFFA